MHSNLDIERENFLWNFSADFGTALTQCHRERSGESSLRAFKITIEDITRRNRKSNCREIYRSWNVFVSTLTNSDYLDAVFELFLEGEGACVMQSLVDVICNGSTPLEMLPKPCCLHIQGFLSVQCCECHWLLSRFICDGSLHVEKSKLTGPSWLSQEPSHDELHSSIFVTSKSELSTPEELTPLTSPHSRSSTISSRHNLKRFCFCASCPCQFMLPLS